MVGDKEGTNEEQDTHEEGVGHVVAGGRLNALDYFVAVGKLQVQHRLEQALRWTTVVKFGHLAGVDVLLDLAQTFKNVTGAVHLKLRCVLGLAVAFVLVHWELVSYVNHLLERLLDEDEGDESGEILLCEARDVADKSGGVECHQQEETKPDPHTDPETKG